MIKYLAYISKQSHILSDEELVELLKQSRSWNAAHGISGMLVSYLGNFTQFIEGPEDEIDSLFAKISKDQRHHQVIPIEEGYLEERQFNDWNMAFRKLERTDVDNITGFTDFDKESIFTYPQKNADATLPAILLLQNFIRNL
ncbi:hypothetical protein GCM10009117_12000 [Gangjinia marincola]|uniref:BLUF domain-containing protein n=1 Tax=Gangjinia marincola TaxID=578463 RepID=A0ABN1MG46_9FLAO